MATIQEVYIALFGRPADPIGYDYYVEATNDGANLDAVGDLSASAEYNERFEGMSSIEMVNQIYMDLFGRPADNAGLAFYVGLLNSGEATQQDIAIRIIDGATDVDAEIIANKVEAANLFTETVRETEGGIAAYSGEAAADAGRQFLNGVDENEDSIPSEEDVQNLINDIASGDFSGGVGQTFTLQNGEVDTFDGTSGDDLFRAPEANSLETVDSINGGAGIDTLRATLTASAPAPVMSGVENVYLTAGSAAAIGLDLDQVSGVQQLWAVDVTGGFTASNVDDLSTTFGAEGAGGAYTYNIDLNDDADISGSDDALMLAVDDVDGNAVTFTVDGAADDDIESISLAAMGDDDGTSDSVNLAGFDGVEDITITGSGDVTVLGVDSDELETFDATAAEGDVIADLSAVDDGQNLTIMGGAGDDTLTSNGGESLITGGAGNDTLVGGIGDDIFGGGAGLDGISLAAGGSDEVHLNGFAGLDTVTDFQAEADNVDAGVDGILGTADDVVTDGGQDVISFLDGGVIDFANSDDDSGRGDSDLDDDDYNEFVDITALQASTDDLDQSVVNVTGGSTALDIQTFTTADAAEFYAAFEVGGQTLVYYDADWSNNDGRDLIATVDTVGLTQDNFDIYA